MAIVVKDRVQQTSTTTGTSDFVLSGSVSGYQGFSVIGNNTTYYCAVDPNTGDWEVGIGTYNTGTTVLSRTTVLDSTNAGNKVNFAAGTRSVFCTYPAEKAIYEEVDGDTIINGGPITIWGTGISATPNTFGSTVGQMFANENNFSQLYNQNLNGGQYASSDFVAYNNQTTTGEEFYVDMGINSSGFNDTTNYPIFPQNSAYVYSAGVDGGTVGQNADLYVGTGTSNSDVVLFVGGLDKPNIAGIIKSATQAFVLEDGAAALTTDTGEKLQVYGTAKVTGATTFGSTVTLNANPSLALQAATKQYVDSAVSTGFVVHQSVRAATTTNLNTIYNNGTAGVGATLTADTNREFTTLDGVTGWSVGQRVLIKNQTSSFENGAYTVTNLGSTGVSPWVLTRATDFDTAGAGEIATNAYFYVTAGSTNIGSSWIMSQTAAITVGTTALPFDLFAQPVAYTGGTNIDVTGTTISLTGTVAATNGGTGYASYTAGQMLYADTTTTLAKLGVGSQYQSLLSTGSAPSWGAVPLNQSAAVSGALGATNGGTGQSSYALGDTLYSSATNTLSKLSGNTTTTKKFLTQTGTGSVSAAPTWDVVSSGDISGLGTMASQNANNVAITGGTIQGVAVSGASTIDNTIIGGSTPAAVTGTTVTGSVLIASNGLTVNSATVAANYSIPSGSNALSAGPVTVSSGVAVTIPTGSVWTVV